MSYLGGKHHQSKLIAPVLQQAIDASPGDYFEPFIGGFNIIPKLRLQKVAICSDLHPGLISMYQALQRGWVPPDTITKEEYEALKDLRERCWDDPLVAFAGFFCSFRGMEFKGYGFPPEDQRHGARSGRNMLRKKLPAMLGCRFYHDEYWNTPARAGDVVYCDPPYIGTTGYSVGPFDHETFYDWCENMVERGVRVFVTEYTIPERKGWYYRWDISKKRCVGTTAGTEAPVIQEYLVEVGRA